MEEYLFRLTDYDCNSDYRELLSGFSEDYFERLDRYLNRIRVQRIEMFGREKEEDISGGESGVFSIDRQNRIRTGSYVGLIRFENTVYEIRPRITHHSRCNWGQNVLFWLSYRHRTRLPFHALNMACADQQSMLEILVALFARYTYETLSNQPYLTYSEENCESSFLKGNLLFDRYVADHLTTGRWHKFRIHHKPFVYDNTFNRIVKKVCRDLLGITRYYYHELSGLLYLLDEVGDEVLTSAACDTVVLNPLYEDHLCILDMCRMFLDHLMIDFSMGSDRNFSFLIPMHCLFEDFVYGFIRAHLPEWVPQRQRESFLAHRNGRQVFKTKADIFLPLKRLIVDTKYKVRDKNGYGKGGVKESDMYQMVSYALCHNCENLLLLYPFIEGTEVDRNVTFQIHNHLFPGKEVFVHARFIDILIGEYSERTTGEMTERFRCALDIC